MIRGVVTVRRVPGLTELGGLAGTLEVHWRCTGVYWRSTDPCIGLGGAL